MANSLSNYRFIRVTTTLDTSAYSTGDVLFNSVEIPEAVLGNAGCSKLLNMYVVNQNVDTIDVNFFFSENSMTIGKIKCAESASVYPGFFKVQVQHFNDVERHIVNFIDKIYFCERENLGDQLLSWYFAMRNGWYSETPEKNMPVQKFGKINIGTSVSFE